MIAGFLRNLEAVFGWVLEASWQASVLVALVLLLQVSLRGRLNPRWYHALWLLVVLRLVLPVLPESALSLFQFAPSAPPVIAHSVSEPIFVSAPIPQTTASLPIEAPVLVYPFSFYTLLAVVWLAGALGLLVVTWLVNQRFARQVRSCPSIDDPRLLKIAAEAQADLGLRRSLRLIESAQVPGPAIMGLFHPVLILPRRVCARFTDEELRFIFLHEFAHLKRGDLIVQWLIALLQTLHWFNPVLWYAFRRMRADREPATDALVLSRTGEAKKESYGQVLIKLLEHYHQRHSLPSLVGILEDKDQFKRRFLLIGKFTCGAYGWSLLGVVLIGILSVACLTKSKATEATGKTYGSAASVTPQSQMLAAVQKGDAVALQKLIDQGVDPKQVTGQMGSLLFEAGSPEAAEILIGHGLDPNASNREGYTPLSILCEQPKKNTSDIVRVLLQHGAHPNVAVGEIKLTPLMNAYDGATVDLLVKYGADLKATDNRGDGVMFFCYRGNLSRLEALIRHGVPFDPKTDGPILLVRSCISHNTPVVKWLLEHGVDPNVPGVVDAPNNRMLPLQAAIYTRFIDSVRLLRDHGAKMDNSMITSLVSNNRQVVKLFWESGIRNISELCYLVSQGAPIADLQKLLDQGSPVDPPQDTVMTPLAEAAQIGRLDAVKFLVEHGANVNKGPLYPKPELGGTPLALAADAGQDEIVDYLLQHGAKPEPDALESAVINSIPYVNQRSRSHYEKTVQFLINAGALKGVSPEMEGHFLSAAILTRQGPPNATVLKMLLDAGANPEVPMTFTAENGQKPDSVIGHYRSYYKEHEGKFNPDMPYDPYSNDDVSKIKPLIDMMEKAVADKGAQKSTLIVPSQKPSGDAGEMLSVRTYLAPANFFSAGASTQDPQAELARRSIRFPPGASATFLPGTDKLVMRDTPEQLDLIAKMIDKLSEETFQAKSADFNPSADQGQALKFSEFHQTQDAFSDISDGLHKPVQFSLNMPVSNKHEWAEKYEDKKRQESFIGPMASGPSTTKPIEAQGLSLTGHAGALPFSRLNGAIGSNDYVAVKFLLDEGSKFDAHDMQEALRDGRQRIVQLLWSHGPPYYCSELAFAISQDQSIQKIKELLDKGASVNPTEDTLITPLGVAAQRGNVDVAKLLLSHGAELHPANIALNPLDAAAGVGKRPEMVDFLLRQGAQVTRQTLNLTIAWSLDVGPKPDENSTKIMDRLIQAGALKGISEDESALLLVIACQKQNPSILHQLLNAGLNPLSRFNAPSGQGPSALDVIRAQSAAQPTGDALGPLLGMLENAAGNSEAAGAAR